jgi:hypothetical protein
MNQVSHSLLDVNRRQILLREGLFHAGYAITGKRWITQERGASYVIPEPIHRPVARRSG